MTLRQATTYLRGSLALLLAACQTPLGASPAVLHTVSESAQQEISVALSDMLGASRVLVDVTPWTRSDLLTLERAPLKDPKGMLVQGLNLEKPQVFRLEIYAGQCRIVQVNTGQSRVLQHADCKPAP
jgi:hypothetical protein